MSRTPMDQRFWANVTKTDDCWLWTAGTTSRGYGSLSLPGGGRSIGAHRYSAMLHFGMFDRRLKVLHHCDTPACVRPNHLYLGTDADNMRDRDMRGRHGNTNKTHCRNGHEFTNENTYMRLRSEGGRMCKRCTAERVKRLRRKDAASV